MSTRRHALPLGLHLHFYFGVHAGVWQIATAVLWPILGLGLPQALSVSLI